MTGCDCAGCYEGEPGVWIHSPQSGADFLAWRAKWDARAAEKDRLQMEQGKTRTKKGPQ